MLFRKILCPIDLSQDSLSTVSLAAMMANSNGGELILIHIAIPPLTQESMFAGEEVETTIASDRREFESIRPEIDVPTEYVFKRGNPGPEVVRFAKENQCDLIVLSTHGRTGLLRVLMGSVAEYISRHAHCPVLSLNIKKSTTEPKMNQPAPELSAFVTQVMIHVPPIHSHDEMNEVIAELAAAKATAAPVVDPTGQCVGILTSTDIDRYKSMKQRFAEKDPSVIPEMFEVDEFGQRRTNNSTFEQVRRHMTSPVVTIRATDNCQKALSFFKKHSEIHHLIVVDSADHPLGVIEPSAIPNACESENAAI